MLSWKILAVSVLTYVSRRRKLARDAHRSHPVTTIIIEVKFEGSWRRRLFIMLAQLEHYLIVCVVPYYSRRAVLSGDRCIFSDFLDLRIILYLVSRYGGVLSQFLCEIAQPRKITELLPFTYIWKQNARNMEEKNIAQKKNKKTGKLGRKSSSIRTPLVIVYVSKEFIKPGCFTV